MTKLDDLVSKAVRKGPRHLPPEGQEEWAEAVEKLAKGEGDYAQHGAQKAICIYLIEKYGLTCHIRTVENALTDDIKLWRAEHGQQTR